jgi:ribonuclease HI
MPPSLREATLLQWNCRSIAGKILEIKQTFGVPEIPIMCFNETNAASCPKITGYVAYGSPASPRIQTMTYVRKDVTSIEIPFTHSVEGLHVVIVKVRLDRLETVVVNVYASPSHSLDLGPLEQAISGLGGNCVVTGDFNAHHVTWHSPRSDARGRHLDSMIQNLGFSVLNDDTPTYIRYNPKAVSHLDVTAVSPSLLLSSLWWVHSDRLDSDHFPTLTKLTNRRFKNFPLTNWVTFRAEVRKRVDTVSSFQEFGDSIRMAKKAAITGCVSLARGPAPDMTVKRLQAERRRARRRFERSGSLEASIEVNRVETEIRFHMRKLTGVRFEQACQSLGRAPTSKAYRIARAVNNPVSQKTPFASAAMVNGLTIESALDRFVEQSITPPPVLWPGKHRRFIAKVTEAVRSEGFGSDSVMDVPLTVRELDRALSACNPRSAPGPDSISYQDLRSLDDSSKGKLLGLYNESFLLGEYADHWKVGVVTPIPKPGKPLGELESYRPIVKNSCVAKVYERMVKYRVDWKLESTGAMSDFSSAYRRGRGCFDNLVQLVSHLEQARSEKLVTGIVFLDMKNAFNTANHASVLYECKRAGLNGKVLEVISEFMKDRKLYGQIGESKSRVFDCNVGVPQGAVLSPVLFNILLHRIVAQIGPYTFISVFADDIAIWTCVHRKMLKLMQTRLQQNLDRVVRFLDRRGLAVSAAKTKYMVLGSRSKLSLQIKGTPVEHTVTQRFLGLHIDRTLCWVSEVAKHRSQVSHISNISKLMSGGNKGVSTECAIRLCNAIAGAQVLHTLPVMLGRKRFLEKRYEVLQGSFVKAALGLLHTTDPKQAIAEAGQAPLLVQAESRLVSQMIRYRIDFPSHQLGNSLLQKRGSFLGKFYRQTVVRFGIAKAPKSTVFHRAPTWTAPVSIHCSIDGLQGKKADLAPSMIQSLFCRQLSVCHGDFPTHVYTDGSVLDGSASGSFFFEDSGATDFFRLPFSTSSTTAELVAIREALQRAKADNLGRPLLVIVDSKSALQALYGAGHKSANPLLVEDIHDCIRQLDGKVRFQWAPSHVGIPGNERADQLANQAHIDECRTVTSVHPSTRDFRPKVKAYGKVLHRCWWRGLDGTFRHSIDSSLPRPLRFKGPVNRRYETVVHRLRVGSVVTPRLLFHMGKVPSGDCTECRVPGTYLHLLVHCKRFHDERRTLITALHSLGITEGSSLQAQLSDAVVTTTALLLAFLRSTGLISRL